MKTEYKFAAISFAVILVFLAGGRNTPAQGFKGIMPLESTCEDVKRILEIEECAVPEGVYSLKDFWVTISFTKAKLEKQGKLCYQIPAGRVKSLTITFFNPISFEDFGYDLKLVGKIRKGIETEVYEDKEKGVGVFASNGMVSTAFFSPTPAQFQKFAADCRTRSK